MGIVRLLGLKARRKPVSPSSGTLELAAVIVVAGLAALAGYWTAQRGTTQEPRTQHAARTAALGPVRVTVPREWRSLPVRAARISGIDSRRTLVFEPDPGSSLRTVVTLSPPSATALPSLLPKALSDGASPSDAQRARLDGRQAWAYVALPYGNGETMDVTVLPTTAGVLAVACIAPRRSFAAVAGCAFDVRLAFTDARPMTPVRDLGFRIRLRDVVGPLDRKRVEQRAALQRASTPRAQARAALELAAVHREAVRALAPLTHGSETAGVVRALRASSGAYQDLATSAIVEDRSGFRAATQAVDDAEDRLPRALVALARRDGAGGR